MKTKIIYISGSEIFDMADIQAAFDEVRKALDLKDTVLFGVPVDREDALTCPADSVQTISNIAPVEMSPAPQATSEIVQEATVDADMAEEIMDIAPVVRAVATDTAPEKVVPEIHEETEEVEPAPKKSRGRPRKVTPVAEIDETAEEIAPAAPDATERKVIPILSVLAAKEVVAPVQEEAPDTEEIEEAITEDIITEEIAEDIPEDTPIEPTVAIAQEVTAEEVSIEDMIDDDIPDADTERTLEQLLESMKPLREDHIEQAMTPVDETEPEDIVQINNDADATLAQLASEFAENQDQIVPRPQNESHGKIGKLKNILPFKKVKREENGLMGDLFGWAGIAANDDDFAIPGFFTTAAKK